jgi:thioredoxin 1
MVDSLTAHKSFAELIAGNQPVLIDFYSDWHDACKAVKPILEEVTHKLGNKVILLKIDVDKNPKLARLYNIQSVPTLMIFKNNEIKWRQNGLAPFSTIEKMIRENL